MFLVQTGPCSLFCGFIRINSGTQRRNSHGGKKYTMLGGPSPFSFSFSSSFFFVFIFFFFASLYDWCLHSLCRGSSSLATCHKLLFCYPLAVNRKTPCQSIPSQDVWRVIQNFWLQATCSSPTTQWSILAACVPLVWHMMFRNPRRVPTWRRLCEIHDLTSNSPPLWTPWSARRLDMAI